MGLVLGKPESIKRGLSTKVKDTPLFEFRFIVGYGSTMSIAITYANKFGAKGDEFPRLECKRVSCKALLIGRLIVGGLF